MSPRTQAATPCSCSPASPRCTDHRYHYARWTGSAWQVNEIIAAGGSIAEEAGGSPRYSGGITLDHEDPSRVYLSRQVGAGAWQVETRTTADNGVTLEPRDGR